MNKTVKKLVLVGLGLAVMAISNAIEDKKRQEEIREEVDRALAERESKKES